MSCYHDERTLIRLLAIDGCAYFALFGELQGDPYGHGKAFVISPSYVPSAGGLALKLSCWCF